MKYLLIWLVIVLLIIRFFKRSRGGDYLPGTEGLDEE